MPAHNANVRHLEWAIESRTAIQQSSLELLKLFTKYEDLWKSSDLSLAAQELTAVSFSLWRAAFLAEKSGKREKVFEDGVTFLARMIEDNAIAYAQDKACREWTYNYYIRIARSSLEQLANKWPSVADPYIRKNRNVTGRWDYCHGLLIKHIGGFERLLASKATEIKSLKKAKSTSGAKNKPRKLRLRVATSNGKQVSKKSA